MKQKDKTMARWNIFLKPKHECIDCGEKFKYKYNYNLHIKKCAKSNTFHKKAETVRRFL